MYVREQRAVDAVPTVRPIAMVRIHSHLLEEVKEGLMIYGILEVDVLRLPLLLRIFLLNL